MNSDTEDIVKLQNDIIKLAEADNKSAHFEYERFKPFENESYQHSVSVFTVNRSNNEKFLLKTVSYKRSYEKCLEEILDYMVNSKVNYSSFTVEWCKKEKGTYGEYQKSYFYCENAKEVSDKFYAGKNPSDYEVFLIKLNPIS